jgi:uncharacterized membrane protein YesL
MSALRLLVAAAGRVWDEYASVLLLSALWLLAQVLIVPGPPATATLFDMARATRQGQFWSAADAWVAFREHFWPAWRWGLPNLLVFGLGLYNLSVFWNVPGVWATLRWVWLAVLLVWLGLNLFYWPFYLAATDRSLRNTYANCARFWLLSPATAAVLTVVAVVVGIAGVSTLLPVVLGVVFWLALAAEMAVSQSLEVQVG